MRQEESTLLNRSAQVPSSLPSAPLVFKAHLPMIKDIVAATFPVIDFASLKAAETERIRGEVEVLVTTGTAGATSADMDYLPSLRLICCIGTGYDGVDVAEARRRGIAVTYGAGTNATAVADHAMGLLLALLRYIPQFDRTAKEGKWRGPYYARPILAGKSVGLLGLGGIGEKIARRAAAFDTTIHYHTRRERPDVNWQYVPSVVELAEQVDCLIVAAPGGRDTHHIVDREVIEKLGPDGYLINIGRASIVDTAALVRALKMGSLGGAALDVFDDEPDIGAELRALDNVILTPHTASISPETQLIAANLMLSNIKNHFAGEPLVSPIPL